MFFSILADFFLPLLLLVFLFCFVILPLVLVLGLIRILIARYIPFKKFLPYFIFVILFTLGANILWEIAVFNKLYYEWDRLGPPITLLTQELPYLDGSSSWIAEGWTIVGLHIVWLAALFCIYTLSIIATIFWLKNKNYKITRTYLAVIIGTSFVLLLFPILILSLPGKTTVTPQYLQRKEVLTPCKKPTEQNRILYKGHEGDYISAIDGENLTKIWERDSSGYYSYGTVSPDGSMVAYIEHDGLWIRCVDTDGQYKISFDGQNINGKDYNPGSLFGRISWSSDSTQIVFNYAGDLIIVNAISRQKTEIYSNVAFKNNGIYPYGKKPANVAIFQIGTAFWTPNGDIFYSKFAAREVELRKLSLKNKRDELIFVSTRPVDVVTITPDSKIIISEGDWYNDMTGEKRYFQDKYIFDLITKTKGKLLYGLEVDGDIRFDFSKDGRYLLAHKSGHGLTNNSSNYQIVALYDAISDSRINIKEQIFAYLQKTSVTFDFNKATLNFKGWSQDNQLLFEFSDWKKEGRKTIIISSDGVVQKVFDTDKPPTYLVPSSWI